MTTANTAPAKYSSPASLQHPVSIITASGIIGVNSCTDRVIFVVMHALNTRYVVNHPAAVTRKGQYNPIIAPFENRCFWVPKLNDGN